MTESACIHQTKTLIQQQVTTFQPTFDLDRLLYFHRPQNDRRMQAIGTARSLEEARNVGRGLQRRFVARRTKDGISRTTHVLVTRAARNRSFFQDGIFPLAVFSGPHLLETFLAAHDRPLSVVVRRALGIELLPPTLIGVAPLRFVDGVILILRDARICIGRVPRCGAVALPWRFIEGRRERRHESLIKGRRFFVDHLERAPLEAVLPNHSEAPEGLASVVDDVDHDGALFGGAGAQHASHRLRHIPDGGR